MIVKKYETTNVNAVFSGFTLLSADECMRYKHHIKKIWELWWLRSPSFDSLVHYVYRDGSIRNCNVYYDGIAVRPVLIIESSDLCVGNRFNYRGYDWTVISEKYALCDTVICQHCFNQAWESKDANNYEKSSIKKYLDALWDEWKADEVSYSSPSVDTNSCGRRT